MSSPRGYRGLTQSVESLDGTPWDEFVEQTPDSVYLVPRTDKFKAMFKDVFDMSYPAGGSPDWISYDMAATLIEKYCGPRGEAEGTAYLTFVEWRMFTELIDNVGTIERRGYTYKSEELEEFFGEVMAASRHRVFTAKAD